MNNKIVINGIYAVDDYLLKHRAHRTHERIENSADKRALREPFFYFSAFFHHGKVIVAHVERNARIRHKHAAFKMKVKTAEIHIDRADEGYSVIAYDGFCVDKSRGVFVNFDSALDKRGVI